MSQHRRPIEERFLEKAIPKPNSGCWLWLGALDKDGYGHICLGGASSSPIGAHRAALLIAGREIPVGMSVLHHCDVPSCVNPDHLYIGTQKDNAADMMRRNRYKNNAHVLKGRKVINWNERKTHCLRGHPLSGDNLRTSGKWRFCRACDRLRYEMRKENTK